MADPSVTITSPTSSPTWDTASGLINISGVATDDVEVVEVTWSNDQGGSGTATGTDEWSVVGIVLVEGVNVITVTATDGDLGTGVDTLTVTFAIPEAPLITPEGSLGSYRNSIFDGINWKRFVK